MGLLDDLFFTRRWLNGVLVSDVPRALEIKGAGITHSTADGRSAFDFSGLAPTLNALAEGAAGDGTTDDTAPLQAAVDALSDAGGGVLHLPKGRYRITAQLLINNDNVILQGDGSHESGTVILIDSTSAIDAVKILDCQGSGLRQLKVRAARVYSSGYAVAIDGCFRAALSDVWIEHAFHGIQVTKSTETWLDRIELRSLFGLRGINYDGTSGANSHALWLHGATADNPYPQATTTVVTWSTSLGVTAGQVSKINSKLWQCVQSGTTASSGTGPSAIPGSSTTPSSAFSTDVTDGSAKWRYVANGGLDWLWWDNYAYTLVTSGHVALLNGNRGLVTADTAASGSSYPSIGVLEGLEVDHQYDHGIDLAAGSDIKIAAWASSCLAGTGILIESTVKHQWRLIGCRVFGNAEHGIQAAQGYGQILNCEVGHNSTKTANTYDGINVAANIGNVQIIGNWSGDLQGGSSNQQRYGIRLSTGTGDHIQCRCNRVNDNDTGGVGDATSGSNNSVGDNLV